MRGRKASSYLLRLAGCRKSSLSASGSFSGSVTSSSASRKHSSRMKKRSAPLRLHVAVSRDAVVPMFRHPAMLDLSVADRPLDALDPRGSSFGDAQGTLVESTDAEFCGILPE